jgi:hypothetical protein
MMPSHALCGEARSPLRDGRAPSPTSAASDAGLGRI